MRNIPSYLPQAILATVFCCMPFGVVAIVYAVQVNTKLEAGDYEGAQSAADSAKKWCWLSFGSVIAIMALYIIFLVLTVLVN